MKFATAAAGVLALAASVVALPTAESEAADLVLSSDLKWTGLVHLDQAPVTLTGTAEDIYRQITALNPNYDAELGIDSANSTITPEELGAIEKRAPTSSDYTCAYGNYVNVNPIGEGIRYLYRIGNADCVAPAGSPGNGGCSRVSCSANAGIWLCNDQNFETHIPCTLIADNAVEILIKCQYTTYSNGAWNSFVRGQIFSTNRGWNTIINSASC